MTRAQQIADCLVDGSHLDHDRRVVLEDIDLDQAIEDEIRWLTVAGESGWAKRVARANRSRDRLFDVAHYLYWLRRDLAVAAPLIEIDELLYALGHRLPPGEPRPARSTLIYGPPPI
jgi:hypothetical protein